MRSQSPRWSLCSNPFRFITSHCLCHLSVVVIVCVQCRSILLHHQNHLIWTEQKFPTSKSLLWFTAVARSARSHVLILRKGCIALNFSLGTNSKMSQISSLNSVAWILCTLRHYIQPARRGCSQWRRKKCYQNWLSLLPADWLWWRSSKVN